MTQKQRIEELEAKVAELEARLAVQEARPVYPYPVPYPVPQPRPYYPLPWRPYYGNTSPNGYGTYSVNDGGI